MMLRLACLSWVLHGCTVASSPAPQDAGPDTSSGGVSSLEGASTWSSSEGANPSSGDAATSNISSAVSNNNSSRANTSAVASSSRGGASSAGQNCASLAAPDVAAACACAAGHACTANNCYGGYWCDLSSNRCVAPPTNCALSSSAPRSSSTATGVGGITIMVEPSDNGAALVRAIQNAQTSVWMTMYILSATSVINALIAQQRAGHDVKVILNQTFPGGMGSNDTVYAQLQAAGVAVHWGNPVFTFTHEKCVMLDHQTAWIMTMNAASGAFSGNREYLAVDTLPGDVAQAEAIFTADWTNATPAPGGDLLVAPVNARPGLLALINGAQTTVEMEAEALSDYQIVDALGAASGRGVQVHIVLAYDASPATAQTDAVAQLKTQGASMVTVSNPYIHAKSMVVDGARAYVGSENFTTNSLMHNRELGVILTTPAQVQKILTATRADFAAGTPL